MAELVRLEGSARQIEWAEQLRGKAIAAAERRLAQFEAVCTKYGHDAGSRLQWLRDAIETMHRIYRAEWWIEAAKDVDFSDVIEAEEFTLYVVHDGITINQWQKQTK